VREILFKAKKKNNGEWVEGYYVKSRYYEGGTIHLIVDTENEYDDYDRFSLRYEIDPDTLCQYTGLTDKNGTKIFENDIVNSDIVSYDYTSHKVVFENRFGSACFGIVINDRNKVLNFCSLVPADKMVVIGNIFDNPELIGGVEE
jgi:uncharacterized phage protein (TIGR01671 family)